MSKKNVFLIYFFKDSQQTIPPRKVEHDIHNCTDYVKTAKITIRLSKIRTSMKYDISN